MKKLAHGQLAMGSFSANQVLITWEWEPFFVRRVRKYVSIFFSAVEERDINIALIYSHGVGIGWKRRRSSQ